MSVRQLIVLIFVLVLAPLTGYACAQQPLQPLPFWDREMKIETGALVAEIALDGFQTQNCRNMSGRCSELNPLARPFVSRGNAGQAAGSAIGLAAVLGTSYLFHKFHHDRLSRWTMRISLIVEGANDAYNFR